MEIMHQFGFDIKLFSAQIINFIIILFILKKFLYKPLLDMLRKRQQFIDEGLNQADEYSIRMKRAIDEEKQILRKAQGEAVKIIEEAKNQSINIIKLSEESGQKQGERIIKEARNQIIQEIKQAEYTLIADVSKLALKILEKSLKNSLSEKTHKEIIDKLTKQIQGKAN
ncbi:ATP synthase subunit b [Candidatus Levyibacteriota bacterium]|nr:ATP synthase F0 subunit B [Candidatus Levybacteria bacterium]GDX61926.1 ATP synthase subunit b [Candidatus Levybacteria bacterium]